MKSRASSNPRSLPKPRDKDMTDWIDYFVYAVFLIAIFFAYPWAQNRLTVEKLLDRNPQWVTENPDNVRGIVKKSYWILWAHMIGGVVSLYFLTRIQLRELTDDLPEKWMLLWQLSMVALYAGIIVFGTLGIIHYLRFQRGIPVAEQRTAALQPRSLDEFVPLPVRLITYSLVIANLIAWSAVAVLGWHDDPIFWARLIIIFGLSFFFWLATRYAVGHRPNAMDRLFGSDYRRGEVWLSFSTQLLTPMIGAVRLYEELADVFVFNINRAMFLGLALYIALWLLWTTWLTALKSPRGGAAEEIPQADVST